MPPSSPRLPSLGPGGAGVARIGGGTFSPPVRVGVGKPPLLLSQDFAGPGPVGELLRKHGAHGGGTFLSPSSLRLLSLGPGRAGVGRIGGGTFSPPVRVGVGKPPLLLSQDFAGPGPVGELLRKHGAHGGGTFLSPSSLRLLSLGPGKAGVGRIGGGTFSPPVRVGVGKPPLLLSQDFAGPGPVGEFLQHNADFSGDPDHDGPVGPLGPFPLPDLQVTFLGLAGEGESR